MKVAHIADIQINLNQKHADRTTEYRSALFRCAKSIVQNKVDIIVIAGDVFERQSTTDDERKLYVDFVHYIMSGLPQCQFIVIDGNHDIKQRNFTYYNGVDNEMQTNVLQEISSAINSDKYIYSRDAHFVKHSTVVFACWSELAKYDTTLHRSPYADMSCEQLTKRLNDYTIIDVYHGTLPGAVDLGTNYEPTPDDVKLVGQYAMLGHIHKHQELRVNDCQAVYSSSLVQRTFNEGIRIAANEDGLYDIYDYSNAHGYVLWSIDEFASPAHVERTFVPIQSTVQMVTIVMSKWLTKDKAFEVCKRFAKQSIQVKLVLDNPDAEALAFLYNYANDNKLFIIKKVESVGVQTKRLQEDTPVAKQIELTSDSLCEVAKACLEPTIMQQHANDEQYGKDVLDKTLSLLKQELGYHLHPENNSSIRIVKASISNFKTIEHAELNFLQHGLQALRGQNGQGKTSCFEAIAFALTGQHNRTFKRNAKNQQFVRLFNDKRPFDDVVSIEVIINVDGKAYTIQCILRKTMHEGWTPQNWKSCVARVVKSISIIDDDVVIASGDDADAWLLHRFGTYEDFSILHMIDQATLDSLKYMQPSELSNFILQRLGYSFVTKLQAFYAGCKNVEQQSCPKPTEKTYVQLCQEQSELEVAQANKTAELNELRDTAADYDSQIRTLTDTITFELNRKHHLPTELIEGWQKTVYGHECDDIDAIVQQAENYLRKCTEAYERSCKSFENVQSLRQQADAELAKLVESVRQTLNASIDTSKTNIDKLRTDMNVTSERNKQLAEQRKDIQSKISAAELDYATLKSTNKQTIATIDVVSSAIEQLEQKLTTKPDKCPVCGNNIDTEHYDAYIADINEQLQAKQSELSSLSNELDKSTKSTLAVEANVAELKTELANVPNDIDISETLQAIQTESDTVIELTAKLSMLSDDEYREKLLTANRPQLAETLRQAMHDHMPVDVQIVNKAKEDLTYIKNVQAAFDGLKEYDKVLADNSAIDAKVANDRQTIQDKSNALANANNAIANCKANLATIDERLASIADMKLKVVAYNISQEALQHYKWLINDALPKYLYVNAVHTVNEFINSEGLPDTIRPWLSETNFGELMLRDRMHDGRELLRPIVEASGMELTIAGLVICLALHNAKLAVDFPMVLIDELSGKLNTGTEYDSTDYLALLLKVLKHASKTCQIMTIDHRIDDDAFDDITTIIKDKLTNTSRTL